MDAREISTVGVIGAGTMGAGIAAELARAGCCVRLTDADPSRVRGGLDRLRQSQKTLVDAGVLSARRAAAAMRRIVPTDSAAGACDGVDLLIEAVSEDMGLKQSLFRQFDQWCPKRAVLATNTSGLSITAIAGATTRPARVAGLHFWNPPHIIPLVEVVRGRRTSPATARLLMDLMRRIGKTPILVRHDVPGFVGNRLQFAVFREALHLVAEGIVSPEDVDTAMTAGPGLRWALFGPLRIADLGGLDVFHAISRYLFRALSAAESPPDLLRSLVKHGHFGAKSGRGFYRYAEEDAGRMAGFRDRALLKILEARGGARPRQGGGKRR